MVLSVLISLLLAGVLLVLSVIDIRTHRLPDVLTLPLIAIGLSLGFWADPGLASAVRLVGAALGYFVLWALSRLFLRLRGYHGLGLGDAKLLAAAGAWLGPFALAPLMLVASASALLSIGGLALAGRRFTSRTAIPFGPFLSLGFFALWSAHVAGWSFP